MLCVGGSIEKWEIFRWCEGASGSIRALYSCCRVGVVGEHKVAFQRAAGPEIRDRG